MNSLEEPQNNRMQAPRVARAYAGVVAAAAWHIRAPAPQLIRALHGHRAGARVE
jgi:hypothetical protein